MEEMTVSDYVLKCGRQADEIDRLREESRAQSINVEKIAQVSADCQEELNKLKEQLEKKKESLNLWLKENGPGGWIDDLRVENAKLKEAIKYALDIENRQHGDDYAYDDCWKKLRQAIGVKDKYGND